MSYNSTYYKPPGAVRGRGGFRGRGGNDGSWQPRGRGRGNYSSGPHRGSSTGWYNNKSATNFHHKGYDRNTSGSRESSDRFSNRGSDSDFPHRYNRQGTAANHTSRNDHGHNRNPDEAPRKRIRSDNYSADSMRRGHDEGFDPYGSDRYEESEKSNFGGSDERVRDEYREDRRPSASRREDFSQRTRETTSTTGAPHSQPYRGSSYRGRFVTRGRGGGTSRGASSRGAASERPHSFIGTRSLVVDSFKAKKRLLGSKPDFFKSKLQKLRSFAMNKGPGKPGGRFQREETWREEATDKDTLNGEDDGIPPEKKVKIVKKVIRRVVRKKDAGDGAPAEANAPLQVKKEVGSLDLEDGEEEEIIEEEIEVDMEEPQREEQKIPLGVKRDVDGRPAHEENRKKLIGNETGPFSSKCFLKLQCPHCRARCLSYKDYHEHLRSSQHIYAMREVSLSMKQTLMRMRTEQRAKQRIIEETEELEGKSSAHTNFCPTCKLNYRQEREKHITSEMHKKMKDYLMPFCAICHISFKSPMLYENHICSLEHLRAKETARNPEQDKGSLIEDEKDVDMNDLLILDSVGSADESEGSGDEGDTEKSEGSKTKRKHEINLGSDYVRKVQVLYCDLCEMYLPRREQLDAALSSHCRTRNHLQRYVRYRDDAHLRRQAELIHKREQAEQEAKAKSLKDGESGVQTEKPGNAESAAPTANKADETVSNTSLETVEVKSEAGTESAKAGTANNESGDAGEAEDKLWADVDKGLDELLREVAPGCKSSDEDDDSGRYDRFKHSKAEDAVAEGETVVKQEAEADPVEKAAE